ncbi:MAG: DUF5615 family PIN-like protein [Planctomycetota bacterium]
MKILADVNITSAMVTHLRSKGHDLAWAVELMPEASDRQLIEHAVAEGRVLLSFDSDFGELAFRYRVQPPGIILIRWHPNNDPEILAMLDHYRRALEQDSPGSLIVITKRGCRVRPLGL